MRSFSIDITEADLHLAAKRGVLEVSHTEHPSEFAHYGYTTTAFSFNGVEVHSYQVDYGHGNISNWASIEVGKDLYFALEGISQDLKSFRPKRWARKFFNNQ